MKSKFAKFAQVAAFGLALAFSFSCSSGGDDDGTDLTLFGQVYTQEFDYRTMNIKYIPYTGPNITFTSNTEVKGSINGGRMSFRVGVPDDSLLEPFESGTTEEDEVEIYPDAIAQPSDTRGIGLEFLDIDLTKENTKVNFTTGTIEIEVVFYLYIDKDCTITAKGGTTTEDGDKYIYQDLNLKLKKGWNTINMKMKTTNLSSIITTTSVAVDTGDLPSCKWVLGDDGFDFYGSNKNLSQFVKKAKLGIQRAISANK